MKLSTKLSFFALFLAMGISVQAKPSSLLEIERSNAENTVQQIKDIRNGNSSQIKTGREYTHLLWEAFENMDKLSPSSQDYLKMMKSELSGFDYVYTTPDGYYKIYYKLKDDGDLVDGLEWIDNDNSGDIDLVENYGRYLTTARQKYLDFQLKMPYSNVNEKGNYEIYISNSACRENVYGYTSPTSYTATECPSYVVVRSDYSDFGAGKPAGFKDSVAAQITLAHEFQHSIQMIYSNPNMSMFVKEGCAVWSEQFVYPGEKDPFNYISNFLSKSNIGLNYDPRKEYDPFGNNGSGDYYLYPYGSWIYFQYLTDMFGDQIIRELYESMVIKKETPAFELALSKYGTTYSEVTKNFYTTVALFPYDEAKKPIYFSRGEELNKLSYTPQPAFTSGYTTNGSTAIEIDTKNSNWNDKKKMLNRLSSHYYRFITDRGANISITPQSNDSLVLILIQYDIKGDVNNAKYSEVNAFGQPASLSYTYDPQRPNVIIQVYNNTTKFTASATGWNLDNNSAFYTLSYQPDASTANVDETPYALDFSLMGIAPMPATDISTLSINITEPAQLSYTIYDMSGKVVRAESIFANPGELKLGLNLNGLVSGSYFVQVSNGIKSEKMQFIVK